MLPGPISTFVPQMRQKKKKHQILASFIVDLWNGHHLTKHGEHRLVWCCAESEVVFLQLKTWNKTYRVLLVTIIFTPRGRKFNNYCRILIKNESINCFKTISRNRSFDKTPALTPCSRQTSPRSCYKNAHLAIVHVPSYGAKV
jgi:hypothetical protein